MQENQQKSFDLLGGYSKAEIKMQLQQKYDEEIKRMTDMVNIFILFISYIWFLYYNFRPKFKQFIIFAYLLFKIIILF